MANRSSSKYDTEALRRKLTISTLGFFGFVILMLVAVSFFGPQIGSLFGFISANRNKTIPQAEATINAPTFIDLPKATSNKTLNIEGYSYAGSTVKLFLNGPEKGEVLTGADGKFVFDGVTLIDGRNTVFAKAVDENGKTSERSDTYVIAVDTKEPEIAIYSPKNGAEIKNLNRRVKVEGEISEEAKITVNGKLAVQQPDLTFEYLLGVDEGNVEIKVKAVDEAGNEKEEKIFIKYIKD